MERWPCPLQFCEGVAYRLVEPHGRHTAGGAGGPGLEGQMLGGVKGLTATSVLGSTPRPTIDVSSLRLSIELR